MQTVEEKIRQRRRQMLVHSFLYYELDSNIIDDYTWSKWGVELAELQKKYPKESAEVEYADLFSDWDGSSGAHLVYDEKIKSIAYRLYCKQWGLKPEIVKSIEKSQSKSQKSIDKNTKIAEKMQKPELKVLKKQKTTKKSSTRSLF